MGLGTNFQLKGVLCIGLGGITREKSLYVEMVLRIRQSITNG